MKRKQHRRMYLWVVFALCALIGTGFAAADKTEGAEAVVSSMTVKGGSGDAKRTVRLQTAESFWKELLPETGNRLVFLAENKDGQETLLGEISLEAGSGIVIPKEQETQPEAGTGSSVDVVQTQEISENQDSAKDITTGITTGGSVDIVTGGAADTATDGSITETPADKEDNITEIVTGGGISDTPSAMEYAVFTIGAIEHCNADTVNGSLTCLLDVSKAGSSYGTWKVRAVLRNDVSGDRVLAEGGYEVTPVFGNFAAKKSKALEKKSAVSVTLKDLSNTYGISKLTFDVYNSKEEKAASIRGKKKASGAYKAEVPLKKLGYQLDIYTVKAVLTDDYGNQQILKKEISVDLCAKGGTLTVNKKGQGISKYRLKGAYLPGNIQGISFTVYRVDGSEEQTMGTYEAKKGKGNVYLASVKKEAAGDYKVCAYATAAWGKKILLNQATYQMKKSDMGKNGWYYEKYNGKQYKFYYVDNVKQTDVTDILGLQESNGEQGSNLLIEINRAASNMTIYLYNEETGEYDIPVKTCAISVGRDTSTNAGASGLNSGSSYTPLGDFSICTNGTSPKYTLKPMYEPNGSTVYARWCSHVVGNVYIHAIAVGVQSHYALNPSTYNKLGTAASAGCVRMTVADAKWIYDYAKVGTTVRIKKGDASYPGPLGKAKTIKVQSGISYDPTDPEVPDSRKKADYQAGKISGYMTKDGKRVGY